MRGADNTCVFRGLADDEGLAKRHTSWVLAAGHPAPTHAVAVDDRAVAASVASLVHHRAYLAHLPGHPEPAQFIPEILTRGGSVAGVEHAVALRAYSLGSMAASRDD